MSEEKKSEKDLIKERTREVLSEYKEFRKHIPWVDQAEDYDTDSLHLFVAYKIAKLEEVTKQEGTDTRAYICDVESAVEKIDR